MCVDQKNVNTHFLKAFSEEEKTQKPQLKQTVSIMICVRSKKKKKSPMICVYCLHRKHK
jgi:hypothetical protein